MIAILIAENMVEGRLAGLPMIAGVGAAMAELPTEGWPASMQERGRAETVESEPGRSF